MKIYQVYVWPKDYPEESAEWLTASEDVLLKSLKYYKKQGGLRTRVQVFDVKTQGKNFNTFALGQRYKKPF